MNGLGWLRRQGKPKPATGGLVGPPTTPLLEPGPAPYVIPTQRRPADDWPTITLHADPPDLTTEQIETMLADSGRAMSLEHRTANGFDLTNGQSDDCGCGYRYSRCYCLKPPT